MLSFVELLTEMARGEISVSAQDVQRLRDRFGDKTLQMGHLQPDGSMLIPTECVVAAAQKIGRNRLADAVENLHAGQIADLLHTVESLLDEVVESRQRLVHELATAVRDARTDEDAQPHWNRLDKLLFG